MSRWNPRYLEYCRVNGESDPEKMLEKDRERWPGGCMVGFSLWIQQKWHEWYLSIGLPAKMPLHDKRFYQDHAAFDRWLSKEAA